MEMNLVPNWMNIYIECSCSHDTKYLLIKMIISRFDSKWQHMCAIYTIKSLNSNKSAWQNAKYKFHFSQLQFKIVYGLWWYEEEERWIERREKKLSSHLHTHTHTLANPHITNTITINFILFCITQMFAKIRVQYIL